MAHRTVIPQDGISLAPLVAIYEAVLGGKNCECVEQVVALFFIQSNNMLAGIAAQVKGFLPE